MATCSENCDVERASIPRYCGPEGRCEPCNELACQETNIPFQCLCHCIYEYPRVIPYPGEAVCPPTDQLSKLEDEDRIDQLEKQMYVQWIVSGIILALLAITVAIVLRLTYKYKNLKLRKLKSQQKTSLQQKDSKDSGIDKSSTELAEIMTEQPTDKTFNPHLKMQCSTQETNQEMQRGDKRSKTSVHKFYFDSANTSKTNAAETGETDEMLKSPAKYEEEEDDPGRLREFHAEEAGDGNPTNKPDIHLL